MTDLEKHPALQPCRRCNATLRRSADMPASTWRCFRCFPDPVSTEDREGAAPRSGSGEGVVSDAALDVILNHPPSIDEDPAFTTVWLQLEARGFLWSEGNIEKAHLGWMLARALQSAQVEPAAWTGSGSMVALKDGREGFIWPAKADAHPIPLFARPPGEVIALQLDRKVGMKGCAYDPPGPCRAYTYEHQPSNLPAYSLGRAHAAVAAMSAGDNIDRGLGLLKALEDQGFGVFEIARG